MGVKCFKCEVPELKRTCITAIIDYPIDGAHEYIPNKGERIESVSISTVKGHPEIVTLAIMLSKDAADA